MRCFGVAALLALVTSSVAAHDPITTTVTYAREVRAIVGTRCVTCHAPGGSAPMPLTTYEETRPWARAIKEQVLTRRMPKWHAARGFGAFANDPTLTPFEIALLVSWIDGGLPRDTRSSVAGATAPVPATLSPPPPPLSRPRTPLAGNVLSITLPAGVAELSRPIGRRWVTGWDFQPGDPLITSATLSLADGTSLGNWVAGDRAVTLPPQTGIRISGRLRIALRRRAPADFEQPYKDRPSVLRLTTAVKPPAYRAWTLQGECASLAGTSSAQALAIRPALRPGGSVQIALDRIGAPSTLVGWFRDFDPAYERTYWLRRPLDFGPDARLTSDGPCSAAVILRARR